MYPAAQMGTPASTDACLVFPFESRFSANEGRVKPEVMTSVIVAVTQAANSLLRCAMAWDVVRAGPQYPRELDLTIFVR
jgi:hypothetical protein